MLIDHFPSSPSTLFIFLPPHHSLSPPPGTGTVVVDVTDLNDNRPRLEHHVWEAGVNETSEEELQDLPSLSLLRLSLLDRDTDNDFLYRVSL
ncbi:hypothetical protein E2C01_075832 [Portunus trituberculatus]|uniref:Neural-cadherin n=1 Tax=Portunus trituberculatus TaxID=210409 RepID=A0A5B7IG30_PORTR|nr:hypothetical protein [Portunus trituberculatus]